MTQSDERETIWLTEDALAKKKAELEELRGPARAEIVDRISAARDEGDLKENSGYHAAREALSSLDGRIAQLEQMLDRAEVGEVTDDGTISPGYKVTYRLGTMDPDTCLLGAREMMTGEDIQVISPQSPLGSALIGAKKGQTVSYTAPNGKDIEVEIQDAEPYSG
ncbi:transcription elongation factor GreA [Marmoricola endophyticus]|uniref:Transcription elongation factor GreA n=1 Tax=Marmoricola endophyticus TaxID=2040280 RepID=A0A917BRE6_9ACTN|nr:transcription elongation factor GreA [Marmoricola endophyticus]GGF54088.1 transcription elongation factor GreA [Marmoricola endophyticus]